MLHFLETHGNSVRLGRSASLIGIVFFLTRASTLSQSAPNARHLLMCKLRRTLVKQISRQKLRERLRSNQTRVQTANNRAAACGTRPTHAVSVIFFSTLVPGSGNFQLSRFASLGYALVLGFWVVFTIIVSLTQTLTLITTLTVILP